MPAGSIIAHLFATSRKLTNATPLDVCILDGSGNQIASFGGTGGTSSTDQSAFVVGTGLGTPAMGLFEAAPTNVIDGKVGVIGMTTDRKLKVSGSFSASPITSATTARTNTADSASSVTVLASNSSRLNFSLYNDSSSAVRIKLGAVASATSFEFYLLPQQKLSTSDLGVNYTGVIDAIWDTAPGGAMRATEFTA